jgi:hypothetical protein
LTFESGMVLMTRVWRARLRLVKNYTMWESICEVLRAARADGNGMRCLSTVYGDLWGVEAQMLSA